MLLSDRSAYRATPRHALSPGGVTLGSRSGRGRGNLAYILSPRVYAGCWRSFLRPASRFSLSRECRDRAMWAMWAWLRGPAPFLSPPRLLREVWG